MKDINITKNDCQKVSEWRQRGILTRQLAQKIKVEDYYNNPNKCVYCGKPIPYYNKRKGIYCSHSCAAVDKNAKLNFEKKEKVDKGNCMNCGKEKGENRGLFCSWDCYINHKTILQKNIIEGDAIVSQGSLRRYLMFKYKSKCQQCGWGILNPISNTVCLDMHHIDGDYKNNKLSNVELLCPNCHSLTSTYKRVGKDRKSTRTNRTT